MRLAEVSAVVVVSMRIEPNGVSSFSLALLDLALRLVEAVVELLGEDLLFLRDELVQVVFLIVDLVQQLLVVLDVVQALRYRVLQLVEVHLSLAEPALGLAELAPLPARAGLVLVAFVSLPLLVVLVLLPLLVGFVLRLLELTRLLGKDVVQLVDLEGAQLAVGADLALVSVLREVSDLSSFVLEIVVALLLGLQALRNSFRHVCLAVLQGLEETQRVGVNLAGDLNDRDKERLKRP